MKVEFKEKIAQYSALGSNSFRVVKSIAITQNTLASSGEMEQQLSIVLARDDSFAGSMLYLDLFGVRDLRLHQPSWSLITLSNIEMTEIGLLDVGNSRVTIRDGEQDEVFSCSCRDFYFAVK